MSIIENALNWIADTFARTDVIDLYFIMSDLIDIPPETPLEAANRSARDSASMLVSGENFDLHAYYKATGYNPFTGDDTHPGKTVIG